MKMPQNIDLSSQKRKKKKEKKSKKTKSFNSNDPFRAPKINVIQTFAFYILLNFSYTLNI